MTAVLIPTASEAEWLAARRRGVTASEIPVVMGLSPYSSPYALYHQKLGTLPAPEETDAMALGKHMESFVAAKFAERRPGFAVTGNGGDLFAHPDRPWQMATPDRLVCDCPGSGNAGAVPCVQPLAVLECKIDGGSDEWGEDGTDEIPVHYRCQLLWQMDVIGVGTGYLASLLWHRRQVRVYELTLDEQARADLELMRLEADCFRDRLLYRDEPDVDWRPATRSALTTLHSGLDDAEVTISRRLAISYRAAVKRFKEAERRKDEMTNRLLAALGDGRYAIEAGTGAKVATRSVSHPKRIDTRKLRADHPAVAAECTKPPRPEVRLTAATTKDAS